MWEKIKKKLFFRLLVISVVPVILIFSWFHQKLALGTAESGIWFYNLPHLLDVYSHAWFPYYIGFPTGTSVAFWPFFAFAVFINRVGVPVFMVQALLFGCILLVSAYSTYAIFYRFFNKELKDTIIAPVLFYMCNIGAMVLIWQRFQNPYIVFYAALPICFFFFELAIEKDWRYLFLFEVCTLLFSIAFAGIPNLILFWVVIFTYVVFYTIVNNKSYKKILFAWGMFALSVILWFCFNAWWLLQFIQTLYFTPYITSQAYTITGDVNTLVIESQLLGNLSYVFRLIHLSFFQNIKGIWGGIYLAPFFTLLSFIIPFLAFLPLLMKKRSKFIYFFLGLSLLLIFLMKGTNSPFGGIFLFLFLHFRFLEAFRNPFEKFGLALPFAYAPLIGYSLVFVVSSMRRKVGELRAKIFLVGIYCLLFIVLVFPLWNGWVFTNNVPPTNDVKIGYKVKVPDDYQQVNTWLQNDSEPSRIVALPINGESIINTWQYGYQGVEVSNMLLNKPVISLDTGIQFLDPIVTQLQYSLLRFPQSFTNILSLLNAKYLLVRSDINYHQNQMLNPAVLNNFLATSSGKIMPNLLFEKKFGDLTLYKNTEFTPLFSVVNSIYQTVNYPYLSDVFSLTNFQKGDAILADTTSTNLDQFLLKQTKATIINQETQIDYSTYPTISFNEANAQMPFPKYLPGSKLYSFITLKEKISSSAISEIDLQYANQFTLMDKRLGEIRSVLLTKSVPNLSLAVNNYIQSISDLKNFITMGNQNEVDSNIADFQYKILSEEVFINALIQSGGSQEIKGILRKGVNELRNFEIAENIRSFYPSKNIEDSGNNVIYRFVVQTPGDYDILLKSENFLNFYEPLSTVQTFQINNDVVTSTITTNSNWIDFGKHTLVKGINEIQIQHPTPLNLIAPSDMQANLFATGSAGIKTINIENFDQYAKYVVSVNFWIERGGRGPIAMQIASDNDTISNGNDTSAWNVKLQGDGYNNGWINQTNYFTPNRSATVAQLLFNVPPYNNCIKFYPSSFFLTSRCYTDKNLYTAYTKDTSFWYKDLTVERLFTNPMVIMKTNDTYIPPSPQPKITFKSVNSSQYVVSVTGAQKPFILVFSESFNSLWSARFKDSGTNINSKDHFVMNQYANAWYIDRTGTYQIVVNFDAEKNITFGEELFFVCVCISLGVLLVYAIRKVYD